MDIKQIKTQLNKTVDSIIGAEKVTKPALAEFSRDYLPYVLESGDVGMVERLIKGLSPQNKRIACLFFPRFMPWEWDETSYKFGKKLKGKELKTKQTAIETFLSEESNNIWTWAERNTETKERKVNYFSNLTKLIDRGLAEEGDTRLTPELIVSAIVSSEQMDLNKLFEAVSKAKSGK